MILWGLFQDKIYLNTQNIINPYTVMFEIYIHDIWMTFCV